jgi:hypothetical protein
LKEDLRPPFLLENVSQGEFNRVKGEHANGVSTLILKDVDAFSVHNSPFMADTKLSTVKDQQF